MTIARIEASILSMSLGLVPLPYTVCTCSMMIPRSFMHEMNDDRIMSRTCLRQRSVIITLPSLGGPSTTCDCHESFARGTAEIEQDPESRRGRRGFHSPQTRRRRSRPSRVDEEGHHDMRCKFAYTIGRHNTVQHALQNQLREAGLKYTL